MNSSSESRPVPQTSRVARFEAGVEHRRQPLPGLLGQLRERDADGGGHVRDVRSFEPGVVHGGESPQALVGVAGHGGGDAACGPAARWPSDGGSPVIAAPGAAAGAEQLQRVRELGQVADTVHAVRGGETRQAPSPAASAPEWAATRDRLAAEVPAGEQHDLDVAGGGVGEDRTEQGPVPTASRTSARTLVSGSVSAYLA